MANNNSSHYLMPTFDSEEAFNAYFAKETAAVAPYRDSQGHLVLDDIHDLPKVIDKVSDCQNSRYGSSDDERDASWRPVCW